MTDKGFAPRQKNWNSLQDVFHALHINTCSYIILRNFENLFEITQYKQGSDIDFLVEKKSVFVKILDAVKRDGNCSHYKISVCGINVSIDIRERGDGYYCSEWEQVLLDTRILYKGNFYVMRQEEYYYTLIYHCIVHKGFISEKYLEKINFIYGRHKTENELKEDLLYYMEKNNYMVTGSTDVDLKIHKDNVPRNLICGPKNIRDFFKMLNEKKIGYVFLPWINEEEIKHGTKVFVLIRSCDRPIFMAAMQEQNFNYNLHPSRQNNEIYAYNTPPPCLWTKINFEKDYTMMKIQPYIDKKHIDDFFALLNKENIRYSLIKNIADELPCNLKDGNDIDILVNIDDHDKFTTLMGNHGWLYRATPFGREGGWNFAYNLPEYQFYQLGSIPQNFYVDACFKLMVKSLTPKTWVPLNDDMQQMAWKEREWNKEMQCWQLGPKTLLVYLFARCVFDKREFNSAYIAEIEKRKALLDNDEVKNLLASVFYKFTPRLLELARQGIFQNIVGEYISFQDY